MALWHEAGFRWLKSVIGLNISGLLAVMRLTTQQFMQVAACRGRLNVEDNASGGASPCVCRTL